MEVVATVIASNIASFVAVAEVATEGNNIAFDVGDKDGQNDARELHQKLHGQVPESVQTEVGATLLRGRTRNVLNI